MLKVPTGESRAMDMFEEQFLSISETGEIKCNSSFPYLACGKEITKN